jgi:hypothetical protein
VLVPGILINLEAKSLGKQAALGDAVQAAEVLGVPVLDVSAPRVAVLWSDPKTPWPTYFGTGTTPSSVSGTLLGQTANSIVLNLSILDKGGRPPQDQPNAPPAAVHVIVRFDSRQVIVNFL